MAIIIKLYLLLGNYANLFKYMLSNHDKLIKVLIGVKPLNAVKLSVMCFYKTAHQSKKKVSV